MCRRARPRRPSTRSTRLPARPWPATTSSRSSPNWACRPSTTIRRNSRGAWKKTSPCGRTSSRPPARRSTDMKACDPGLQGPLKDVRVVDLSRLVAGNMLSLFLADFGADVIKVERPEKGDDLRNWREAGQAVYWKVYGRNKRSAVIDFKSSEGMTQLKKLIKSSQILVEDLVAGGLVMLGWSHDVLHELVPGLVIARVSGLGQSGPYKSMAGFGILVEAMSGFAYLNGYPDDPPALPPVATPDMIAGIY